MEHKWNRNYKWADNNNTGKPENTPENPTTIHTIWRRQNADNIEADKPGARDNFEQILKMEEDVIFNDELGTIQGKQHLNVDPEVVPWRIPNAMKEPLKNELWKLEGIGVKKKITETTDCVNQLTIVKKNNKIIICIYPRELNRALKREHYILPILDDILNKFKDFQEFRKLAWKMVIGR